MPVIYKQALQNTFTWDAHWKLSLLCHICVKTLAAPAWVCEAPYKRNNLLSIYFWRWLCLQSFSWLDMKVRFFQTNYFAGTICTRVLQHKTSQSRIADWIDSDKLRLSSTNRRACILARVNWTCSSSWLHYPLRAVHTEEQIISKSNWNRWKTNLFMWWPVTS